MKAMNPTWTCALAWLGACAATTDARGASAYLTHTEVAYQAYCGPSQIRSEIGPSEVRYLSSGSCRMLSAKQRVPVDSTFFDTANATELYRFSWAGVASYNPTTKATREEVIVQTRRADGPVSKTRPNGRFTYQTICAADPWLRPPEARCAKASVAFSGNLLTATDEFAAVRTLLDRGGAFTALMAASQRQALLDAQRRHDEQQAVLARVTGGSPRDASSTRLGSIGAAAGAVGPLGAPESRTTSVQSRPSTTTSVSGSTATVATAPVAAAASAAGSAGQLEQRALNPQPLPPRDAALRRHGLNPQPLPPRSAFERTQ